MSLSDDTTIVSLAERRREGNPPPLGDDHPEWSQEGRWPLLWCLPVWIALAAVGYFAFYVLFRGVASLAYWTTTGIGWAMHQADFFFQFRP